MPPQVAAAGFVIRQLCWSPGVFTLKLLARISRHGRLSRRWRVMFRCRFCRLRWCVVTGGGACDRPVTGSRRSTALRWCRAQAVSSALIARPVNIGTSADSSRATGARQPDAEPLQEKSVAVNILGALLHCHRSFTSGNVFYGRSNYCSRIGENCV